MNIKLLSMWGIVRARISECDTRHIVAFGFVVRLLFSCSYVILSGSTNYLPLTPDNLPNTGIDGYIQIAHTLLHSGIYALSLDGYPVSFRGPAQPLLMLVTCAWSEQYWALIWAVCASAMGAVTIIVSGKLAALLLGEHCSFGEKATMIIVASQPYLIFSTKSPSAIVTLTLVFTLTCMLLVKALKFPNHKRVSILLGLTLGFGMLLHGSFLPLTGAVVLVLLLISGGHEISIRFRQTVLILLTAFVILLPWLMRNKVAFGEYFPMLTGSGLQYWIADGCYFHGPGTPNFGFSHSQRLFESVTGRELKIHLGGTSREDDLQLLSLAKSHLIENPQLIPLRVLHGAWRFWAPTDKGWKKSAIVAATNVPYLMLFCFSLFYAFYKRRFKVEIFGPLVLILCFYGLFSGLQAISVYFVVILPAMLALAFASLMQAPQSRHS